MFCGRVINDGVTLFVFIVTVKKMNTAVIEHTVVCRCRKHDRRTEPYKNCKNSFALQHSNI